MPKKNISLKKSLKNIRTSKPKRSKMRSLRKTSKPKRSVKKYIKKTSKPKMSVKKPKTKRRMSKKRMLKKVLTEQCRSAKIKRTMHEFKTGDLKLVNGKIVTNRKQAIAIALSQANRYC
jgi:hypothetical protein